MADYNVNMKQWNGTSFDNVLPLAYLAKDASKLEGKTYAEILAAANQYADNYKFVIGVYNGKAPLGNEGQYQKITLGFKPKYLIITIGALNSMVGVGGEAGYIGGSVLGDLTGRGTYGGTYYRIQYLDDGFQVGNVSNVGSAYNVENYRYIYFAVP